MSAPLAPRRARPRRLRPASPRPAGVLLAVLLLGTTGGCDEKLQAYLKNASERQSARDAKKAEDAALEARGMGPQDPISPEIARAIEVVRTSDYDFIVRKGKPPRKKKKNPEEDTAKRFNGVDFAGTLESKTRWLGRGVTDLPTWLDEIGSGTFFSGDAYLVRLPDGRELTFRDWLLEELAYLPPVLAETPK